MFQQFSGTITGLQNLLDLHTSFGDWEDFLYQATATVAGDFDSSGLGKTITKIKEINESSFPLELTMRNASRMN